MFKESHQNLSFPVSLYVFCLQENGMQRCKLWKSKIVKICLLATIINNNWIVTQGNFLRCFNKSDSTTSYQIWGQLLLYIPKCILVVVHETLFLVYHSENNVCAQEILTKECIGHIWQCLSSRRLQGALFGRRPWPAQCWSHRLQTALEQMETTRCAPKLPPIEEHMVPLLKRI